MGLAIGGSLGDPLPLWSYWPFVETSGCVCLFVGTSALFPYSVPVFCLTTMWFLPPCFVSPYGVWGAIVCLGVLALPLGSYYNGVAVVFLVIAR